MSKVDKKVALVNNRVNKVVSKFEAYINNNTKKALQSLPAQSHNLINAHEAIPIASDSEPSLPNIITNIGAQK
jgi:hypothetical protein